MSAYDQQSRADLREHLLKSGIARARATEIVDLACHASDAAIDALTGVTRRGSDLGIVLIVLELAAQLTRHRCDGIFERTHDYGKALGASAVSSEIVVAK